MGAEGAHNCPACGTVTYRDTSGFVPAQALEAEQRAARAEERCVELAKSHGRISGKLLNAQEDAERLKQELHRVQHLLEARAEKAEAERDEVLARVEKQSDLAADIVRNLEARVQELEATIERIREWAEDNEEAEDTGFASAVAILLSLLPALPEEKNG